MARPLHFDKIEDYLTGQMSQSEARAFEQEVANDPDLSTELELQRLEHNAMERMLEQELKSKIPSWGNSPPVNPFQTEESKVIQMEPKKNWRILRYAATVSGILLVAMIIWQMTNKQPVEVVDKPPTPEQPNEPNQGIPTAPINPEKEQVAETPNAPTTEEPSSQPSTQPPDQTEEAQSTNRPLAIASENYDFPPSFTSRLKSGDGTAEKSALFQAAEAFDKRDYTAVLDLLGLPGADDQSTVHYLRGHAYFNLKQYAEAANEFKAVASDEFLPNYQEAQWYLLLSYLAQVPETENEFKALAKQLAADEYSDYQNAAKELLETLR